MVRKKYENGIGAHKKPRPNDIRIVSKKKPRKISLSSRVRAEREKELDDILTGKPIPLSSEDGHAILAEIKSQNGFPDRFAAHEQAPEFDPDAISFDSAKSALEQAAETPVKQSSLSDRMYDDEDVDIKTRLTKNQIVALQIAEMEAQLHNTPMLLEFCEGLKKKNISLGGQSRKEAVEMTQGFNNLSTNVDAQNRTRG